MTNTDTKSQRMWANLDGQGTAMAETALCDDHQHTPGLAREATRIAMDQPDFGGMTARTRCSNEELACFACLTDA
jgi:hypothetical protein